MIWITIIMLERERIEVMMILRRSVIWTREMRMIGMVMTG